MTNYWQLAQRMASLCPIFISFIPNSQSARTHTKRHLSLYTDIQMHTPNEKHNKNDPLYILSASTRVGAEELQVSSYRVPEQTLVESHTYLTCVVYSLCRICAWLSIKAPILQPTFFRSCDAVTFFFFSVKFVHMMHAQKKLLGICFLFFCLSAWRGESATLGKCWELTSTLVTCSFTTPTPTTFISLLICSLHFPILFFFLLWLPRSAS